MRQPELRSPRFPFRVRAAGQGWLPAPCSPLLHSPVRARRQPERRQAAANHAVTLHRYPTGTARLDPGLAFGERRVPGTRKAIAFVVSRPRAARSPWRRKDDGGSRGRFACRLRVGQRAVSAVDVPMRVGRSVRCSDVLFVRPAGPAVAGVWLGLDVRVEEGAAVAVDADRLVQ
jgi:hypothetical protein